jgi:flavin-dependent dehydrogenase
MEKRSIIIVGSGPAGISTALSLFKLAPELARETLILEKYRHPREKLCGGGITAYADMILSFLGITIQTPCFPIHQVRMHFHTSSYNIRRKNVMRIVHRPEFDAELVRIASKCNIEIRQLQPLRDIRREGNQLELTTSEQTYRAPIVVAADGARSLIRRRLFSGSKSRVSRLMETLIPVIPESTDDFRYNIASMDFRPNKLGLQGYVWDFPGFIAGKPYLNTGVFDSRVHRKTHADLPAILQVHIRARGLHPGNIEIKAHPERWFHESDRFSMPNVLLTGDAAGVEPMLGEGISMALAYGPVAARAIVEAAKSGDYSFETYKQLLMQDKLGRLLRRNRRLAYIFYTWNSEIFLQFMISLAKIYLNRRYRADGLQITRIQP